MITDEITADLSNPGYISLTVNGQPGPRIELLAVFQTMVNAASSVYDGKALREWEAVFIQLAGMCGEKVEGSRGPVGLPCKI